MEKQKVMYCGKCNKRTIHELVSSESEFEGTGLARIVVFACTLGMSETAWRNRFWQCKRCGEIQEE